MSGATLLASQLRQSIAQRQLSPMDYFLDLDPMRRGELTDDQFLNALQYLGFNLDPEQAEVICNRYRTADGISYRAFINEMETGQLTRTAFHIVTSKGKKPDLHEDLQYDEVLDNHRRTVGPYQYTTRPVIEGTIKRDIPNDLEDLLSKLRLIIKQRRIRVKEFITDHDRLRSGLVTRNQLRACLSMAQLDLSNAEFELICQNYSVDENRLNYFRFCDDLDAVFTSKNLEKTNTEVILPRTEPRYGETGLDRGGNRVANNVVNRFRDFMVNKVLDVKSHFQDWDRHNSQKISPKQFRQVLASFKFYMTDEELAAIHQRFNDGNFIKYLDFIQASRPRQVEQFQEIIEAPQRTVGSFNVNCPYCMNNPPNTDVAEVLNRIRRIVWQKRIRAEEFMREHDILRKGTIPISKFRSAVDNMKMDLTARDLDLLEEYFLVPPDLVNYVAFVQICETVFTQPNLERDPLRSMEGAPDYLDPKDVLDANEERELFDCLQRLAFQTTTRRILLKPHFQDKDRVNAGWVATTRFRSILSFFKLEITDREFSLLCRRFSSRGNEVSYLEFLSVLRSMERDEV